MKKGCVLLALALALLGGVPARADVSDDFGESIGIGDINRDGYPDLAIGDSDGGPSRVEERGRVHIISGKTGRSLRILDGTDYDKGAVSFGERVAVGDINRDGFRDVVVLDDNSFTTNGEPRVHVISGRNFGLLRTLELADFNPGLRFPSNLAVGDLNKDGFYDIALSAAGGDILAAEATGCNGAGDERGAVVVLSGRTFEVLVALDATFLNADGAGKGETFIAGFGEGLAFGNVDGKGGPELVISDGTSGVGGGIFIFRFTGATRPTGTGGPLVLLRRLDVLTLAGEDFRVNDIGCARLNRDRFAEIVIGDDSAGLGGRVFVISGKTFEVVSTLEQEEYDDPKVEDEFGESVAAYHRTRRTKSILIVADHDRPIDDENEGVVYVISPRKNNPLLGTIDATGVHLRRGAIRR